eukprot:8382232-Alexandrium_andersonii.AAC.1
MSASLVGSEMCIRDRVGPGLARPPLALAEGLQEGRQIARGVVFLLRIVVVDDAEDDLRQRHGRQGIAEELRDHFGRIAESAAAEGTEHDHGANGQNS